MGVFWEGVKRRWRCYLVLLGVTLGLIVVAFYPVQTELEGELFVREISFTYGGETDALFLNYISLRKVQVRGEQSFQLNGDFDCETTPALDRVKLLTIQLNSESGIIFSSKSPGVAQLAVSELRLKPQTSIARLSYNPSKETPSLLLQLEAPEEKQSNLLEDICK